MAPRCARARCGPVTVEDSEHPAEAVEELGLVREPPRDRQTTGSFVFETSATSAIRISLSIAFAMS